MGCIYVPRHASIPSAMGGPGRGAPARGLGRRRALDDEVSRAERRRLRRQWAELIRRIYEADPLLCTCGAQMRLVSFITEPPVVRKILEHLKRTGSEVTRAPPRLEAAPEALVS